MKLRWWGVRGSIPAPGPETNRYGGNTSCVSIETAAGGLIIIDMGTGLMHLGDYEDALACCQRALGPAPTLCSLPGTSGFGGGATDWGESDISDGPSSARNRMRVEFSFGAFRSGSMPAANR